MFTSSVDLSMIGQTTLNLLHLCVWISKFYVILLICEIEVYACTTNIIETMVDDCREDKGEDKIDEVNI